MALPTIVINSAGSNTAASGAGPATALHGTGAATAGSTTVNLSADAPDLSGVATDGSAVIWVGTSSGRQFSKITGVDNTAKTVTVAVTYSTTESGKNWGIGGKRASMGGSTALFNADWALGWTVDVQTGETLTAQITVVAPTPDGATVSPKITSTTYDGTWGSQPLIQIATNSTNMFNCTTTGLLIENLSFKSTATTKASCWAAVSGGTGYDLCWRNCIFDGFAVAIDGSGAAVWYLSRCILDRCEIMNCTMDAVNQAAVGLNGTGPQTIVNCYFHDNKVALFMVGGPNEVIDTIFANNVAVSNGTTMMFGVGSLVFKNNTVYHCGNLTNFVTGSAVYFGSGGGAADYFHLENNIFYGNTGYAVLFAGATTPKVILNQNNAYGANNGGNTGLNLGNLDAGSGDVTLTASPFVSTVTPDYALNNTAGGGAACKGAAALVPAGSATLSADIGAIPSAGAAAGPAYFAR